MLRRPGALRSAWIALVALAALAFAAGPSRAHTITPADVAGGGSFVDLGFATVAATGGSFVTNTLDGYPAFGVSGGSVDWEIDLAGESITITFAKATLVDQLEIGQLFAIGQRFDTVNEQARLVTDTGTCASQACVLAVTGASSASWSGPGGAPGAGVGPGAWVLDDPFAGEVIHSITFLASSAGLAAGSKNSDFSIVSVTASDFTPPVPEPTSAALLAAGVALLAARAGRARVGRSAADARSEP